MIRGILWLIAVLAVAVPTLVVRLAPPVVATARHRPVPTLPRRVVPPAELPPVEPLRLVDLTPDDARSFNAEVPFFDGPNPPARPFRFAGADADRARAVDCLAVAVLYEAGNDTTGQKAVAQVVLNRLRHPAFPKSVCAVVFEGSQRSTGCQFTFTCDGALTRWTPSPTGWARAQQVAAAALAGAVFKPVGYATHYHTDWVVPYWQSSLDKIARVGTHLFFRWTGWWGTPPAFNRYVEAPEPVIAAMAVVTGASPTQGLVLDESSFTPLPGAEEILPVAGDPNSFLVTLPTGLSPSLYPELAARACGDRGLCKFLGWADHGRTATALPLQPQQIATMTFSYLRDRLAGLDKVLWNCEQVPRPDRTQCMKAQVFQPGLTAISPSAVVPKPGQPKPVLLIDGIRHTLIVPSLKPVTTITAPAPAPRGIKPPGTSPVAVP